MKQHLTDWIFEQLEEKGKAYEENQVVRTINICIDVSDYMELKQQAREMYQDEIEAAIIKQCAEESTSEAHKTEVHRNQIMAAYKAAMHTQYLESYTYDQQGHVIHKAEKYYNEKYNTKK